MELFSAVIHHPFFTMAACSLFVFSVVLYVAAGDERQNDKAKAALPAVLGAILLGLQGGFPEVGVDRAPLNPAEDLGSFLLFAGPWLGSGIGVALVIASAQWSYRRRHPLGPAPRFRTGMIEPVVSDELARSLNAQDLAAWIGENTKWFVEMKVGLFGRWKRDTETRISQADAVDAIERSLALWRQRQEEALAELRSKPVKPSKPREILSKKVFK